MTQVKGRYFIIEQYEATDLLNQVVKRIND